MVDNMIAGVELRMKDRDMSLELTQPAKALLAERGFDPVLGARPLRRTIQREIEDVLAEKMLFGEVGPGQIVLVDVEGEGPTATFTFKGQKNSTVPDMPPLETVDAEGDPGRGSRRHRGSDRRAEGHRGLTARPTGALTAGSHGVTAGSAQRRRGDLRRRAPSATRPARHRSRWSSSGHAASMRAAVHRAVGLAGERHDPAAALPVGAGPGLAAPRRSVVRREAGAAPRAAVGDRAGVAATAGGRCRPARRAPSSPTAHVAAVAGSSGSSVVATSRSARVTAGAGNSTPGHGARQDPADVGVEHDVPLAEGEAGDRRGGVVADAGQREQVVVRRRHLAVVALDDGDRGGVEAQRATGVAQPAPHPHRLAGGLGGQGGRRRPALEPGRVHRQHPRDRRLLEHELADHHRPRRGRHARATAARARGRRTSRARRRAGALGGSAGVHRGDRRSSRCASAETGRSLPNLSPCRRPCDLAGRSRPGSTGPDASSCSASRCCSSSCSRASSAARPTARTRRPAPPPRQARPSTTTARAHRRARPPGAKTGEGQEGQEEARPGDRAARARPGRADRAVHRLRHRRHACPHVRRRAARDVPITINLRTVVTEACTWQASPRDADRHHHLRQRLHLEHPRVPGRDPAAGRGDPAGRRRPGRRHLVGASAPTRPARTGPTGRCPGSTTSRRPPSAATATDVQFELHPRPAGVITKTAEPTRSSGKEQEGNRSPATTLATRAGEDGRRAGDSRRLTAQM